jgi:hypothetical protein
MFERSERLPPELTPSGSAEPPAPREPMIRWWDLGGIIAGGLALCHTLYRLHMLH